MAWNSNWDISKGRGKLLPEACDELLGAINERNDIIDYANVPAYPTTDLYNRDWEPWFQLFQNAIGLLMSTGFVRHTYNGGDFDGYKDAAFGDYPLFPYWNQGSLLEELYDSVLLGSHSGAVTQIEALLFDADFKIPLSGELTLYKDDDNWETIDYTSFSINRFGVYIFVVNDTLLYSYADEDSCTIRYDVPRDPQLSASWLYQQKQLLNLLRWRQYFGDMYCIWEYQAGEAATPTGAWAAMTPYWQDVGWHSEVGGHAFYSMSTVWYLDSDYEPKDGRYPPFTAGNYAAETGNHEVELGRVPKVGTDGPLIDLFFFAESTFSEDHNGATWEYNQQDNLVQSEYTQIGSDLLPSPVGLFWEYNFTKILDTVQPEPLDGNGLYCSGKSRAILKYTDAFTYID